MTDNPLGDKKQIIHEGKPIVIRIKGNECMSPNPKHRLALEVERAYEKAMKKLGCEQP